MGKLEAKWEQDPDSFEKLSKQDFDQLFYDKKFTTGPMVSSPSKWGLEFGPYDPHRWAFGELPDNRFVCCNTTESQ